MKNMRDFALEVYFSKWEFKAEYNIGGSDMESMSLGELLSLADPGDLEAWDRLSLGYTETYGAPALREVMTGLYDRVGSDEILCFAGAEEGIFCAMHAVLNPEDHALIFYPNYQSSETIPKGICDVSGVALDPERNWTLDIDDVRKKIRPNTKLIYINFPNNPTGKILERDRFDALVDLCRENGIYLFSDEVHRLIERDPALRLPQAVDVYERGLSLNVISKAYGLAGLRIGWIACRDKTMLQRMERKKHFLSICNSAPSEFLTMIALKARDKILEKKRALVERNLRVLDDFFQEFNELFDWQRPDGGCMGFPRYKGRDGVEDFTRRLVEETGVILIPSSLYRSELGPTPTDRFRIGYGKAYLPEAIQIVREFLLK